MAFTMPVVSGSVALGRHAIPRVSARTAFWQERLRWKSFGMNLRALRNHMGVYERDSCIAKCERQGGRGSTQGNMGTVNVGDYATFVQFLHFASPYVVGHRNKIFVILIPGEVMMHKERLRNILDDILLLHGLGCKVVLVAGSKHLIDKELRSSGLVAESYDGQFVGGYRVSGRDVMDVVMAENGAVINQISAMLSKGPPIPMMRRHAKDVSKTSEKVSGSKVMPSVKVVSGNFTAAKRRGVLNGVDFGWSGSVSHIHVDAIHSQLNDGNIVLLTCLGISSVGELLNCSVYDLAAKAAIELGADKFICFTGKDVRKLGLPHYLPLEEAKLQIASRTLGCCSNIVSYENRDASETAAIAQIEPLFGSGSNIVFDLDTWSDMEIPFEIISGIVVCHHDISRSHLVDFEEDGALLLELYSRDGISGVCMIASDIYQGIRQARYEDVPQVSQLLQSFVSLGYELPCAIVNLGSYMDKVMVLERDGDVLACAMYSVLGTGLDEKLVVEINALIVSESHRNNGFGDSMLDYMEQDLRRKNVGLVVIVPTTGSSDWFVDRGFEYQGLANQSMVLPEERRHGYKEFAKLYSKSIVDIDSSLADLPAGRRIGF